MTELDLGADAPRRLAERRAGSSCKMPDCCVLGAAQEHKGTVASFDAELIQAAVQLGLKTIQQPRS